MIDTLTFRPDQWERVREVFEGAQAMAIAERRVFVATACAGLMLRADHERALDEIQRT